MPKAVSPKVGRDMRHNPLEDDLNNRGLLRNKAPKRKKEKQSDPGYIDSRASKQILELGRELETEADTLEAEQRAEQEKQAFAFGFGSVRTGGAENQDDEEEDDEQVKDAPFADVNDDDNDSLWADEDDNAEAEVNPADLATFNKFLPSQQEEDPILRDGLKLKIHVGDKGKGKDISDDDEDDEPVARNDERTPMEPGSRNLADIILAKIAEHEAQQARGGGGGDEDDEDRWGMQDDDDEPELSPKLVEVYAKAGDLLSRYKSGKVSKPLKVLPSLPMWDVLIDITQPDKWTPNAVYEMTKIFISSNNDTAREFLEKVVLESVRDDIAENKKLNVHLFAALKKSLFRPAAFFKGIVVPLLTSGTTTLREAQIISAAVVRTSVPVVHAGSVIETLCELSATMGPSIEQQAPITTFIRALLDKRYALPYQIIDILVIYFMRSHSADAMPVLWHQTFLLFAQRYRDSITEDQREALLDVLLKHLHPGIGPEIRRELLAGRGRGVAKKQEVEFDGDDTMMID